MMLTADDVAAYLMEGVEEPCSTLKLQSLLYYSQGWHLARTGEALFQDPLQAWPLGPVAAEVFRKHQGQFLAVRPWPYGDLALPTSEEKATIDAVLATYGALSGQALSAMTLSEPPWAQAKDKKRYKKGEKRWFGLSHDVMRTYFAGLGSPAEALAKKEAPAEDATRASTKAGAAPLPAPAHKKGPNAPSSSVEAPPLAQISAMTFFGLGVGDQ